MELSETSRWLIQLLVAALAVGTAAWFYLDFAPRLRPDITVAERDDERGFVVLRLTVENVSRVLVHQVADGCRLQVVARPLTPGATYDEFVPLTEARWREEGDEVHLGPWRAPQSILRDHRPLVPGRPDQRRPPGDLPLPGLVPARRSAGAGPAAVVRPHPVGRARRT